jgi:lipid-A-disaccharide synthase
MNLKSVIYAIAAGEPSGDRLGAAVVDEISRLRPEVGFIGIGGRHLRRSNVKLVADIDNMASMGLADVVKNAHKWLKAYAALRLECIRLNVKGVILVDSYEINIRFARAFTADGIKVMWYAGPKIWAWRKDRLKILRHRIDIAALLFPFEKPLYDAAGVPAVYTGHPLADTWGSESADDIRYRSAARQKLGLSKNTTVVAFLPGSRQGEAARLGYVMLESAAMLKRIGIDSVISLAGTGTIFSSLARQAASAGCQVFKGDARTVLQAADCAVIASGTATLEAAIIRTPMIIVYKLDFIAWKLAEKLLNIPYAGLPNWIAGKKIVPELMQDDVTADNIFDSVKTLLQPENLNSQRQELYYTGRKVYSENAARNAAVEFLSMADGAKI